MLRGRVFCCLVVVTAANRAAATCLRWGRKALFTQTAMTGLSRHGRLRQTSKGFPPQRKLSCVGMCMTKDAPPRRMSATALSAAVDAHNFNGEHLIFQAEPSQQNQLPRTPAALRE